jgi:hypothetical protein
LDPLGICILRSNATAPAVFFHEETVETVISMMRDKGYGRPIVIARYYIVLRTILSGRNWSAAT